MIDYATHHTLILNAALLASVFDKDSRYYIKAKEWIATDNFIIPHMLNLYVEGSAWKFLEHSIDTIFAYPDYHDIRYAHKCTRDWLLSVRRAAGESYRKELPADVRAACDKVLPPVPQYAHTDIAVEQHELPLVRAQASTLYPPSNGVTYLREKLRYADGADRQDLLDEIARLESS